MRCENLMWMLYEKHHMEASQSNYESYVHSCDFFSSATELPLYLIKATRHLEHVESGKGGNRSRHYNG